MSWSRAIWLENNEKEEGTIPANWIEGNFVRWPLKSLNLLKLYKTQVIPKGDWQSFPLIKIKFSDDDKDNVDLFNFTSNDESDFDIRVSPKKQKISCATKSLKEHPKPPSNQLSTLLFEALNQLSPVKSKIPNPAYPKPPPNLSSPFSMETMNLFSPGKSQIPIAEYPKLLSNSVSPLLMESPNPLSPGTSKIPIAEYRISPFNFLKSKDEGLTKKKVAEKERTRNIDDTFPLPDSKFQYKVLHLLVEIKDLLKVRQGEATDIISVLKMDTIEEFQEFDLKIIDLDFKKQLKSLFLKVGGKCCQSHARGILELFMTNKLMSKFNLTGQNKKSSIRNTQIISVIEESMPQYTKKEIHLCIGNTLKRAPDRKDGGGR